MQDELVVFRFGPFEFDPRGKALFRGGMPVRLSAPQAGLLTHFLEHPGQTITKERLIESGWPGVAVADISLGVAIHGLRRRLGKASIETRHHEGYRFTMPLVRAVRPPAAGSPDARLEPFLAFVQGRSQVDTLDRDQIRQARTALREMLRAQPDYARGHVLLTMASGLAYEASATEPRRDTAALEEGLTHGQRACELAPESGEAWGALAFVLSLRGERMAAAAAGVKAIALEPENWRLALSLAKVTWGEERVRPSRLVLTLNPGLALAHWLIATVFIARGAWDMALAELRLGCAAQDAQQKGSAFAAVGLHLLHAQVLAALGRLEEAIAELQRELTFCDSSQIYAATCAANTWYTLGGIYVRLGRREEAADAFARALAINPSHAKAMAALHGVVSPTATGMDAVTARAIVLVRANRHEEAARVYLEGLAEEPPGHAGWMLPVDPVIHALAKADIWKEALALVRTRAL